VAYSLLIWPSSTMALFRASYYYSPSLHVWLVLGRHLVWSWLHTSEHSSHRSISPREYQGSILKDTTLTIIPSFPPHHFMLHYLCTSDNVNTLKISCKVKLLLYLTKHHAMKTYWGVEVSGQLHDPAALPLGKKPQYPLDRRLGRTQELVWKWWQKESSVT